MRDDSRCELLCLDLPLAEELRAKRLPDDAARHASAGFQALGDPTRLTIALALRDGSELCVCDLAWISERSPNLVSHHLRALRSEELVRARRDGKMVMYALTGEGEALVETVLGLPVTTGVERVGV